MQKLLVGMFIVLFASSLANGRSSNQPELRAEVGLAATPPMGWGSWNHFYCDYNAQTIREQADALVSTGMRDLGYRYLIIQECIAPSRDAAGNLVVEAARFPGGMKSLVDYIHSKGLKAGMYTDVGPHTCWSLSNVRYEGSFGHEAQDAATFASWGIDLVEVDYCNKPAGISGRQLYEKMASAIRRTERPMLLYMASWGNEEPWIWAHGIGQLWRTEMDINAGEGKADWKKVVQYFESNSLHAMFSAPGGWNDPDMLEVGESGLSDVEASTHFAMWAISAAPLIAGNDLTKMSDATRAILTNPEVIAIDQDTLGAQGVKVREPAVGEEVWAKPLKEKTSGEYAILLLNLTEGPRKIAVRWDDLGLQGRVSVYDVRAHANLGSFDQSYAVDLPPHDSALLRVSGNFSWEKGADFPAVWPGNARTSETQIRACAECLDRYVVSLDGEAQSKIRFAGLNVDAGGLYTISVSYMEPPAYEIGDSETFGTSEIELIVNDGQKPAFRMTGYRHGIDSIQANLRKGDNSVLIRAKGKGTIFLESIRLTRSWAEDSQARAVGSRQK